MKIGVSVKIDVTKIDKARLYKGKKGTYLDLTTFIDLDETDQYDNNGFIAQAQTEDERKSGAEKPPILGNVRVFYKDESNRREERAGEYQSGMQQAKAAADDFGDSEIPF